MSEKWQLSIRRILLAVLFSGLGFGALRYCGHFGVAWPLVAIIAVALFAIAAGFILAR